MTNRRNAIRLGDAQDRGWGLPCPTSSIVSVTVGGRTFNVHRRVAPIFKAFLTELTSRGYRIDVGTLDDWSYVCRHIANDPALPWSNHAWGLAIDVNSLANPMRSPLTTDMPAWIRTGAAYLLEKYGLRWGGTYQTTDPDPMHFEVMVSPTEADAIVARLATSGEWWEMPIPDTEVDRIVAAQVAALQTGAGREALRDAVRHVFSVSAGGRIGNVYGTVNNDAIFVNMIDLLRGAFNRAGQVIAALAQVETIVGPLSDDEDKLAAALAGMELSLDDADVQAIIDHFPNADPDKIAAAVRTSLAGVRLGVITEEGGTTA